MTHITPNQCKDIILNTFELKKKLLHNGFYDENNIKEYLLPIFNNYTPSPSKAATCFNGTKFIVTFIFDDGIIKNSWGNIYNNFDSNSYFENGIITYLTNMYNNKLIDLTNDEFEYIKSIIFSFYTIHKLNDNVIQIQF